MVSHLCFALAFILLLQATTPITSQQLPPTNIFILAGQSNMAGRGGVTNDTSTSHLKWDGIVPPQCQPNPSILRLSGNLTLVEAHEPLHYDIDYNKTNGVGPGMPFANTILTKDPAFGVIGLVPCAIGGTSVKEWQKGGSLYQALVLRTQVALQNSSYGVVRALLWYQGESDTVSFDDAADYKERLVKFFTDFRTDIQIPLLPIIQVALASGEGPHVETVREAQLGLNLSNVQCIDAKGLPMEPDNLHLTTASQVLVGEMLANAFLQDVPSSSIKVTNGSATSRGWFYSFIPSFLMAYILSFLFNQFSLL